MPTTDLCAFMLLALACVLIAQSRDRALAKAFRLSKALTHYLSHVDSLGEREASLQDMLTEKDRAIAALQEEVTRQHARNNQYLQDNSFLKNAVDQIGEQSLTVMLRQAKHTLETAPSLSRLKLQASLTGLPMPPAMWPAYLDSLEANVAVLPVVGGTAPWGVFVRHLDCWVCLHDGYYDLLMHDGRVRGTIQANMSPVPRPGTPSDFTRGARQMRV